MYLLRTLSVRDVVRALKRRELRLAIRIGENLVSNAVNSARFRLRRRSQLPVPRAARRAS